MVKLEKLPTSENEENQFKSEIKDLIYFVQKDAKDKLELVIESLSKRFIMRGMNPLDIDPLTFKPEMKCLCILDLEEIQDNISINGEEETIKKLGSMLMNGIKSIKE